MIQCGYCDGTKKFYKKIDSLPVVYPCPKCNGEGERELTPDELEQENELLECLIKYGIVKR